MLFKWGSFLKETQFAFQEGVGRTEASFTIIETIIHMLEGGSKVFSCFRDVRKAFDTVWIDGLPYKLFLELGIKRRMWLAIRDIYTNVKAQVFYEGSLSRKIDVLQGTGQGRILAPFMYKVYVIGLLTILSNHCIAILMDYAFPLLHLLITYLYLRCPVLSQDVHEYLQPRWYQMEV